MRMHATTEREREKEREKRKTENKPIFLGFLYATQSKLIEF